MSVPLSGSSLRPFGAEPAEQSQAKPLVPNARKRSWRGRFVKGLRYTPPEVQCWLIWSHYHGAWHCRSETGGACGYTSDISRAGVFIRSKADAYNDGDRNEAFHVSEKWPLIEAAIKQHSQALSRLVRTAASAIEAGTAETQSGSVHESAVHEVETPNG